MTQRDLTCQDMVELVTDYLEGALTPEDRARFEAHLDICKGCTNYLEQMREVIRLTGEIPSDPLTPEARDKFLEVFRSWRSDSP